MKLTYSQQLLMKAREGVEDLTQEQLVYELISTRIKIIFLKQDLDVYKGATKLLRKDLGIE